jgi:ribosome-associated toxin RatA of RatAB toxin-antitoxin module
MVASSFELNGPAPIGQATPEDLVKSVDLSTQVAGRQRSLCAKIVIPKPIDVVWFVITDYERLADFIPNLASSRLRRPSNPKDAGKIILEQVGCQKFMKLSFSAKVVLEMIETYPQSVSFSMVEGDFKSFSGSWDLEPVMINGVQTGTQLSYCLSLVPPLMMPMQLIEGCLSRDLAINLAAISQRVMAIASLGTNG